MLLLLLTLTQDLFRRYFMEAEKKRDENALSSLIF